MRTTTLSGTTMFWWLLRVWETSMWIPRCLCKTRLRSRDRCLICQRLGGWGGWGGWCGIQEPSGGWLNPPGPWCAGNSEIEGGGRCYATGRRATFSGGGRRWMDFIFDTEGCCRFSTQQAWPDRQLAAHSALCLICSTLGCSRLTLLPVCWLTTGVV